MASKFKLFDSDDEESDPENCELKINKEYAEKYVAWKEKEELQKLKEKYGDVSDYSSTSEDEEEVNWNAEFDKEWLRVYSAVKFKNTDIYDKDIRFVRDEAEQDDKEGEDSDSDTDSSESEESEKEKTSRKKKKTDNGPLTIRDHERRMITDRNGELSESEDEEEMKAHPQGPSYHEEQEAIRNSITKAVADMSSGDEDEDILIRRIKSEKEKKKEEKEYLQFLKGEKEAEDMKTRDKQIAKDLAPLRTLFSQPEDNAEASQVVWNTVICRGSLKEKPDDREEDLIEEESELIKMEDDEEEFEHTYNFRFEEPDKNFIKQYKRNPEDSVRQEANKRAQKRKEVQERKKNVMEERREEIRRLKKLKQKELESRLQLLMKEWPTGVEFTPEDLKGGFDPQAYDKMMQEKAEMMSEVVDDKMDKKPDLADVDDAMSITSHEDYDQESEWTITNMSQEEEGTSATDERPANEDHDSKFSVNAGYDTSLIPGTSRTSRRARRRKMSKLQQIVQAEADKPLFNKVKDKYKDYDDYLEDHYKLDYKEYGFRYHKVVPNDYGICLPEMMWVPARELNAWVSMKKVMESKSEVEEVNESRKYQSAKMQRKIFNVIPSLKKINDEETNYEDLRPSVLHQQKMMAQQAFGEDRDPSNPWECDQPSGDDDLGTRLQTDSPPSPKQKQKRKAPCGSAEQDSPSRKKKRKATGMANDVLDEDEETNVTVQTRSLGGEGKKKKRRKKPGMEGGEAGEDDRLQGKKKNKETENQSDLHSDVKMKKKKKKKIIPENQEAGVNQKAEVKEEMTMTTEMQKIEAPASSKDWVKQGASEKKKKTKKPKLKAEEQQTTSKKSGKTKFKGKKKQKKGKGGTPKVKGYIVRDKISESRLAAFGIDPRKFKYTKDRIAPLQPDQD